MIYNPFNAWGRQREVPSSPPVDFPPVVPEAPLANKTMSSRDFILDRVRRNQPAAVGAAEMPSFDRPQGPLARLLRRSARAHGRRGRRSAGAQASSTRLIRERFRKPPR